VNDTYGDSNTMPAPASKKSTILYVVNVYFISGMGADHRAFSYITLPKGFEAIHIPWIKPEKKEPLAAYALRLAGAIRTSEPFMLVGLSMGGMMAVEIAKKSPPVCTVLISSIPLSAQLPAYYRVAAKLNAGFLFPPSLLKKLVGLKKAISPASKLVRDMFQACDNEFLKWAMTAVPGWDNHQAPQPLHHIHGKRDRVLPIRLTHPTKAVARAGHMLVMTHPALVNAFLADVLDAERGV
jgi:pimeloyl-ACP methyl ester carboxylesterase